MAGYRELPADSDSDSDTEAPRPQIIHSGHFMVSSPHNDDRHRKDSEGAGEVPASSIDPTLTRLFECMSLAYSGKLVSPKWKNFKGLRLLWRDKIRLNNAIWRAWYLQYVGKRKTPVCGFATPLDGTEGEDHRKPEAVVLEGKYWKRRIEVVMREYNKWRIYHKKRLRKLNQNGKLYREQQITPPWRSSEVYPGRSSIEDVCKEDDMLYDLNYFLTDISDTLFTTTYGQSSSYQYAPFGYFGNADIPGLAPLQPNLDDFMDLSVTAILDLMRDETNSCLTMAFDRLDNIMLEFQKASSPHSCYVPRQDSCFLNTPLTSAYTSSTATINGEHKPLTHYSEPAESYTTDSYSSTPSISIPNLAVENQDILFPLVSCPKPAYNNATTDPNILNQGTPPSIHADVYPLFTEPLTHMEPPHVFSMSKACARGSTNKPTRRTSIEEATSPHSVVSPSCMSACKADSPFGMNNTTGSRSDAMPFSGIPVPVVPPIPSPPTQGGLGFPSSPPAIFLSSVGCSPNDSSVSSASNTSFSTLLPKSERLSPTSVCSDDRKDTLTVPCTTSNVWSKSESKKVESRRITHISAEQKRRCNIKLGFDTLQNMVTSLHGQHNNKLSKATTLQKTADYIYKLQQERAQLQEEAQRLRRQVQELNDNINMCQQQLPASGVPLTHQRFQHMQQMFHKYVQSRTLQNWKFWLFSLLISPLFESFNRMVSTASMPDLRDTSLEWLDQQCSLPSLRPTILSSLCQLSTSTSILTDPSMLPDQAVQAVTRGDNGEEFY
ncbi:carbohydrate-responsive element-binding protein [Gastrophryne carolinensis]